MIIGTAKIQSQKMSNTVAITDTCIQYGSMQIHPKHLFSMVELEQILIATVIPSVFVAAKLKLKTDNVKAKAKRLKISFIKLFKFVFASSRESRSYLTNQ